MTSSKWISPNSDTMVHAILPDGRRVVRRDTASKWFILNTDESYQSIKMDQAVDVSLTGEYRLGIYGGTIFDARMRRAMKARRAQKVSQ
jgi:hypothetical protein